MNTKTRILNTLLIKQEASVNELAEELDVNGISIRHHLKNFEKEGWIVSREERIGQVGRPKFVYSLSSLGLEQFPKSYVEFSTIVLDQLKQVLGTKKMIPFFEEVGLDFAERNRLDRRQRNSPNRLNYVVENLNEQGYIIEKNSTEDGTLLTNFHCPYHYLSSLNPEICHLDKAMLEALTENDVEITQTIAEGDHHCTFVIKRK